MPTLPKLLRMFWARLLVPLYKAARVAKHVDKLDQSAWQRGWADVEHWALNRPIPFTLACAPMAGAFGVLGTALSSQLLLQMLLGAVGAFLGIAISVLILAGVGTLAAPYKQRDEAREAVRAVEDKLVSAEFVSRERLSELQFAADELTRLGTALAQTHDAKTKLEERLAIMDASPRPNLSFAVAMKEDLEGTTR